MLKHISSSLLLSVIDPLFHIFCAVIKIAQPYILKGFSVLFFYSEAKNTAILLNKNDKKHDLKIKGYYSLSLTFS